MKFTCLIWFFAAAAVFSQIVESKNEYDKKYFPLEKNITLEYKSNMGETTAEYKKRAGHYVFDVSAEDFIYRQHFVLRDEGWYLIRTYSKASFLFFSSENDATYSSPLPRFPFPFDSEISWEWQGYDYIDSEERKLNFSAEVQGEELIKTDAGEFKTLKIKTVFNSDGGSNTELTEWLAPGIGIVKIDISLSADGVAGVLIDLLGYDEINFELTEVIENEETPR